MTNLTTIQLIGNVQGYLDLDDETILPLNFAVSDIRDISSRTGSFSKSIKVKGTKNNNKLLNHYFDVNIVAGTFDINIKQSCVVIQNGVTIFDNAILQLISVNKIETTNEYDDQIEYTLLVKDTTSDFFTIINNKYLEDLNLLIADHRLTGSVVLSSFTNTYEQGYKYMLSFNPSNGSTNSDLNDNKYLLNEFKPAIYVRRYFDRIFMEATGNTGGSGFRYSFPSLTSTTINLNNLVIPYNGDAKLTDNDYVLNYNTDFSGGTTQTSINTYNVYGTNQFIKEIPYKKLTMGTEISDPDNLYNPATSIYTTPNVVADTATSKFIIDITYRLYVQNSTANSVTIDTQGNSVKIKPLFMVQGSSYPLKDNPIVIPNGQSYGVGQTTLITSAVTLTKSFDQYPNNKAIEFAVKADIWQNSTDSSDDANRLRFLDNSFQITQNATFRMDVTSVRIRVNSTINTDFGYNSTIKFWDSIKQKNDFAPKKIKQSDFLKGVLGMFNLYAEVDKNDPQLINITPRDEYYDNGVIVDWTNKIVKDEEKDLTFLPLLSNKKLVLTYKQDTDIANKTFFEATNEVYGQNEFIFDNQIVKDIDKKEFIFSPTPMYNTTFGAIVPMLIGGAPNCNIRILYDGGNFSCNEYDIINYSGETSSPSSTIYPHISHWNHPTAPTFDLNFGVCDFYFREDIFDNTLNNLFNLHWRRTVNQINSGKMLTANFALNEVDIANMRLNDKIFINNSYWNINKIIDYNANSNEPTKVELINVDDTLLMPFTTRSIKKVTNSSPPIWTVLTGLINQRLPFVNVIQSPTTFVRGVGNWISPTTLNGSVIGNGNTLLDGFGTINGNGNILVRPGFVFGSGNVVEDDGGVIIGNGNWIPSGITRPLIFGNGITATTSDALHVPNIVILPGGTINGVPASAVTVVQTLQTVTNNGSTTTNPITANAFIKSGGLSTQFLMADGSISTSSGGSSSVSGAGTTNTVAKFSSTSGITNSSITDDGNLIMLGINSRVIGTLTANTFVRSGGTSSQFLKGDGSVDTKVYITGYTETSTLQNVTDRGNTTTQNITANSFVKSGGLSTQFLKANGTIDSNTYLTSFSETDTLASVSSRGANAGTTISATSFVKVGGTSSQFLKADGSIDSGTFITAEVDTLQTVTSRGNGTSTSIQALSFIKTSGLASQFLKADGSSDSNIYITGYTDTYSTAVTYSNNVITVKRNQGQPDMSILINTMTGLTVTGSINGGTFIKNNAIHFPYSAIGNSDIVIGGRNGGGTPFIGTNTNATTLTGMYFAAIQASDVPRTGESDVLFKTGINSTDTVATITSAGSAYGFYNSTTPLVNIQRNGNTLIGTAGDNGTDKLQVNGSLIANTIKKSGGTSSQFLKADGSVDSTAYYPASNPSGFSSTIGTVTNVSALTLGTSGTDLSSSVANATTTPVITLNVPTASASNRGALSSTDWSTFNNKQNALGYTPVNQTRLINTTTPLQGGGDLTADRTLSILTATTSITGVLTNTDWNTFNNKQNALGYTPANQTITISTTSPLTGGGDLSANRTFAINQSNTSTNGYLSSTDWNTFNGKQPQLNGTGFVKAVGTVISYDNSTYALDLGVLHTTGNETFTGAKSSTVNGTRVFDLVNNGTSESAIVINNSSTGNGYFVNNLNGGLGILIDNGGSGAGLKLINYGGNSGDGILIDNSSTSTGKPFHYTKNSSDRFYVDDSGNTFATSFIKSGGTSNQFLKADGSIDNSTYLTSESDQLNTVLSRGNTTNIDINSTGLIRGVQFIKSGGTSSQFLKADGSSDSTVYANSTITISTTAPLTGGGNLTTNRTFAIPLATNSVDGYLSASDRTNFNSAFNERRQWDGGSTNLVASTGRASLGMTNIGSGLVTFGGVGSPRIPIADNTNNTSWVDYATFISSLNLQTALTNPVTGTGTANRLPKFNGTSTLTNSLLYDDGTNIGINTTSPNFTSAGRQVVDINGSSEAMIVMSTAGTGRGYLYHNGSNYNISNNVSGGNLGLLTQGSERVRITATGATLFNTLSDNGIDKIQVNGSVFATTFRTVNNVGFTATDTSSTNDLTQNSQGGVYINNTNNGASYITFDRFAGFNKFMNVGQDTSGNFAIGIGNNGFKIFKIDTSGNGTILNDCTVGGRFIKSGGTSSQYLMADGSTATGTTLPYKIYMALLSQTGGPPFNDPTAIVLENTLGASITWARNGSNVGEYIGTLGGGGTFTVDKTTILTGSAPYGGGVYPTLVTAFRTGNSTVSIRTLQTNSTGTIVDGGLSKTTIEIRVYP